MTKARLSGKVLFDLFMLLHHSLLLKEVRAGTLTGQEPGGRADTETWRVLLTGLLLLACSVCFLIYGTTNCPRAALPAVKFGTGHFHN